MEGSTKLAKQFGDAPWAELQDAHRQLMRRAYAAHGGQEVDAQGDSFFVVFTRATDAVAAALEAQQALATHAWPADGRVRVRIGLHTGEAVARDNHYIGQEVDRASRICDSGHGGQIVVSQTTLRSKIWFVSKICGRAAAPVVCQAHGHDTARSP